MFGQQTYSFKRKMCIRDRREAHHLLPALNGIAETDRATLLRRAGILREVLDQFAAETVPIRRAACF